MDTSSGHPLLGVNASALQASSASFRIDPTKQQLMECHAKALASIYAVEHLEHEPAGISKQQCAHVLVESSTCRHAQVVRAIAVHLISTLYHTGGNSSHLEFSLDRQR